MELVNSPLAQRIGAALCVVIVLGAAALAPSQTLLVMPVAVAILGALALYQFPAGIIVILVLAYGLGLDIQLDLHADKGGTLLGALVKVIPFALAMVLALRHGLSNAINWPFLAFTAIAGISIAVLPIGRIASNGDMIRSFIGSTAPFVIGFCLAPNRLWTLLCRGVTLVPIVSAVVGLLAEVVGFYPAFGTTGRFQGMHSAPFLAGFCTTAIFAAVLEYLRGYRTRWLVIGGLDLAILFATQARAPLIATFLFLALAFLRAGPQVLPLKRKVDLVMAGVIPGMMLLAPLLLFALDRFTGESGESMSGRDIIWPYFIEAIEQRPLFGFGLGAGKLIVNPEDPTIRLLGSNAAHNEYLRLSVDAGIIGCAAIFLSIVAWVWFGTTRVARADALVLRCAVLAVLVHSGFDNTLIATTAVVQFTWFGAALARARQEAPRRVRSRAAKGRAWALSTR